MTWLPSKTNPESAANAIVSERANQLLNAQVEAGLRGDFVLGRRIGEELRQLTPDCPRAAFNRGWYEMMDGRLLKGFELLDHGRWIKVFGDRPLTTAKPIYRDENLFGKYLLLCSEGGLGDEIINVRFAREFARLGAKVIATCDPSLSSVFSRVPGVVAVVNHKAAPEVHHDFWVPAMSAARVLALEYKNLDGSPYLTADPAYIRKWSAFFARTWPAEHNRPRIGLRFYGNPEFEHEQHRRFPKQGLIDALDGRPWVNLQKEESPLALANWEDTLGVISQLDLVITSCTSVAHAAAAMGVDTWVIVPLLPYYVWALPGERSPWYNSVHLFRQNKFDQWSNVFADVARALDKRMPR